MRRLPTSSTTNEEVGRRGGRWRWGPVGARPTSSCRSSPSNSAATPGGAAPGVRCPPAAAAARACTAASPSSTRASRMFLNSDTSCAAGPARSGPRGLARERCSGFCAWSVGDVGYRRGSGNGEQQGAGLEGGRGGDVGLWQRGRSVPAGYRQPPGCRRRRADAA